MRKENKEIPLTKENIERIIPEIKEYLFENFETEISNIEAEMILEYFGEIIGKHYYNLGVSETISDMHEKIEDCVLLMKE